MAVSADTTAPVDGVNLTGGSTAAPVKHRDQASFSINCLGVAVSLTSPGGCPADPSQLSTRTKFVRTDALWDVGFLNFDPQRVVIYHMPTRRFFAASTFLNRVDVIDANSERLVAEIPVPGAFVGDVTPDGTAIYMGTQVGDVYKIDPVSLQVVKRFPALQIGPNGFAAYEVRVLADGRLAMLGGQGGIPAIDGYSTLAIWNPADNSFFIAPRFGLLAGCPLTDHIAEFTLTPDRTKVLLGSGTTSAAVCSYDPVTDAQKAVSTNSQGFTVSSILAPPGSQSIIVPFAAQVMIFDANGLFLTDQFQIGNGQGFFYYFLSVDGNVLFVLPKDSGGTFLAYDWRTHKLLGWGPGMDFTDFGIGLCPVAVDETGLIATVAPHGIAFLDGGNIKPGNPASTVSNSFLSPSFGPSAGGTQTNITFIATPPAVSNVFFGVQKATNLSLLGEGVAATSPPGSPGPVDVTVVLPDGNLVVVPESFSYGPSIVDVATDATSAEGGATGTIYGYGFGGPHFGGLPATGLQVQINGQAVANLKYTPDPLDHINTSNGYFLPIESLTFTFPATTAGTVADVTVSNSAGSTTKPHALDYLPTTHRFPLPGSSMVQGIYDPTRDVYYLTDATKVQVFSKTQGAWLAPINMPAGASRLWGLALSPNGSKLAVGDAGTNQIYVLNPASPSSVSTFSAAAPGDPTSGDPAGLAITDSGIVYYMEFFTQFTGPPGLRKLDTTNRTVTTFQAISADAFGDDALTRVVLSNDNARLYVNNAGLLAELDTATDSLFFNFLLTNDGDYELTLSSNQTWMSANEWLMDTNLNPESFLTLTDRQIASDMEVFGAKVSPDGNLFFQPLLNGIDVFDGKQGILRTHIALPFQLSANYDALVSDGKDNILLGIVGEKGDGGVAVIDLSSLPEPLPPPFANAGAVRAKRLGTALPLNSAKVRNGSRSTTRPSNPTDPHPLRPPHVVNDPVGKDKVRILP